MWRLLETDEVPLVGDEVLQSGSLFAWVPVVGNIEALPVGKLVIRRKIEDTAELGTTPNRQCDAICPRCLGTRNDPDYKGVNDCRACNGTGKQRT